MFHFTKRILIIALASGFIIFIGCGESDNNGNFPPEISSLESDSEVVEPEIHKGRKRGDAHKFSKRNIFEFAVIRGLHSFGITVSVIKKIVDGLPDNLTDIEYLLIYRDPETDSISMTEFGGVNRNSIFELGIDQYPFTMLINLKRIGHVPW